MSRREGKIARQRRFIFRSSAEFVPVRREDIYDAKHIFPQLEPIFDYLANFRTYHEEGIEVDGGAIFCGPPGSGKTLCARYIASVSGARFVNVLEFPVEIKDGTQVWQPKDVTALFRLSAELVQKSNKPVVLFADQFDDFLRANRDLKKQFEIELDGFLERGAGVFLLVTSQNVPRVVRDPLGEDDDEEEVPSSFGGALFRRGRIGTHIVFSRLDFAQCATLLRGFLSKHPHSKSIDHESLVRIFPFPTSADIKYAVSEARQLARRQAVKRKANKDAITRAQITQEHLVEIFLSKVLDKETGHELADTQKHDTCVHELGHYVVGRALGLPVHFASVRSGLSTLGMTFSNDDDQTRSHENLLMRLVCSSGGWEAERLCGIPPNTSKYSDLEKVNSTAEYLVDLGERKDLKKYGVMKIDRYETEEGGIKMSERVLEAAENDISRLVKIGEKRARKILKFFGRKLIEKNARILKKNPHGVMLQKNLDKLFEPKLSKFHKLHRITDSIRSKK